MSTLSESFKKVRYDLRPAKQVERMMLIDAFRRLDAAGMPLSTYRYVGMGSVHFYDFVLFHKYLGISSMLSVEASANAKRRVVFNKPFKFIDLELDFIGNVIPKLAKETKHVLWLDYDSSIRASYLEDVSHAAESLSRGSVLMLTVDLEMPKSCVSPRLTREHLSSMLGSFLPPNLSLREFAPRNLATLHAQIFGRAIARSLAGRSEVKFRPLFNFVYKDGHNMLTIGGMLAGRQERQWISRSTLVNARYYRPSFAIEPFEIRVPVVTRKERMYLDAAMPCVDGWLPADFEMTQEDVEAYREIYRFNPNFAELIM